MLEEIIVVNQRNFSATDRLNELLVYFKHIGKEFIDSTEFEFKDDGKVHLSFSINSLSFNFCIPAKEGLKKLKLKILTKTLNDKELSKSFGKYYYTCISDEYMGYLIFGSNSLEKDPE